MAARAAVALRGPGQIEPGATPLPTDHREPETHIMRRLLLTLALVLGTAAAHADDSFFYAGAGISRSQLSDIYNNGLAYSDIDRTSWKALLGFRPISFVAAEADYLDLGAQSSTFFQGRFAHSNAKAFAAYGVGFLPVPVPFLDLFAKLGASRWTLDGNTADANGAPLFSFSNKGTSFAWGAGGQVHFGNIGARLEYESFNINNTKGAGVTSLSLMLLLP
jgi:Outer membrane protein beta-barrel domain